MAFGFFSRLARGLAKTTSAIASGLGRVVGFGRKQRREAMETLEEVLVSTDMGVRTAMRLREEIETRLERREIQGKHPAELLVPIREELKRLMPKKASEPVWAPEPPTVVMVVGVNGTGKTTSVGKLAKYLGHVGGGGEGQGEGQGEKKRVILAAADTFRAAATEQLMVWAERAGVEIVHHGHGADPGAVAHDAAEAAVARGADVLLVDTAGRLHTRDNLMRELDKIRRVTSRIVPGAPHEVLLVLDATTGQNAVSQAKKFADCVGLTGIFLAKLDGTAKGGVVIAIWNEIKIPVKYVGVGEGLDDILPFDPEAFVDALFPADMVEGAGEDVAKDGPPSP